ncbi:unnamed protein product [Prorocentrum cordatum]|uniref:Uncharacterized protein n=1 Tax=Prorocentrum cordatum TaxID=2364126 RepID=A0ABN9TEL7_9DINO|nr:unnamed protein product [Polarella glacialis]
MPGSAAQISDEAAEAELRELRGAAAATSAEAERRHARELEQLRAELRESRAREAALAEEQGRQSERSDACSGQLRELEAELEESLLLAAGARGGGAAAEAEAEEELRQLQAAAEELAGKLRAARSWAEAEHCKFTDCATEVATLREMAAREFRERQSASKQLVADIKDCSSASRISVNESIDQTERKRIEAMRMRGCFQLSLLMY